MAALTINNPVFNAKEPLRSKALNNISEYLFGIDRLSRYFLVGSGIAYGLNTSYERETLNIQSGVALTTNGYMFAFDNPLTINKAKNFKILPKGLIDTYSPEISAFELTNDGDLPLNQTLSSGSFYIILYIDFEIKQPDENCSNCGDNTVSIFKPRVLAIPESSFSNLPFICKNIIDNSNTVGLPDVSIPRLHISEGNNIENIKSLAQTLKSELLRNDVLNLDSQVVNEAIDLAISSTKYAQYAYAYLKNIVKVYKAYADSFQQMSTGHLQDWDCFPRHVVLGQVINGRYTPDKKTPFFAAPIERAEQSQLIVKNRFLLNTLRNILNSNNLDFNSLDRKNEINFTPSSAPSTPLSMQAIPYYFNSKIREYWRFELRQSNRINTIPYYDNNTLLTLQPSFDDADFYRIEGHIGKKADEAKKTIEGLKDANSMNLPFKVVVLNENTFRTFIIENPGLEHQGGVPKGGTFIIRDVQGLAIADYCLPYYYYPPVVIPDIPTPTPPRVLVDFDVEGRENLNFENNDIVFVEFIVEGGIISHQLAFENLSENATRFEWRVFVDDERINAVIQPVGKDKFTFTFTWSAVNKDAIYRVELIANGNQGLKHTQNIKREDPRIGFHGDTVVREIVSNPIENATINRDFITPILAEGQTTPALTETKSYHNAVEWMRAFPSDMAGLSASSKRFKEIVDQYLRNIKKSGGVPDAVYRTVLKNMIFHYFDGLVALLPSGLSEDIAVPLNQFFEKVRADQVYIPHNMLVTEWDSLAIKTSENEPVIAELNKYLS